jgi:hypothetical protein
MRQASAVLMFFSTLKKASKMPLLSSYELGGGVMFRRKLKASRRCIVDGYYHPAHQD